MEIRWIQPLTYIDTLAWFGSWWILYRFLSYFFFQWYKLGQEKGPDPFLNRKMHWASWNQDKHFFPAWSGNRNGYFSASISQVTVFRSLVFISCQLNLHLLSLGFWGLLACVYRFYFVEIWCWQQCQFANSCEWSEIKKQWYLDSSIDHSLSTISRWNLPLSLVKFPSCFHRYIFWYPVRQFFSKGFPCRKAPAAPALARKNQSPPKTRQEAVDDLTLALQNSPSDPWDDENEQAKHVERMDGQNLSITLTWDVWNPQLVQDFDHCVLKTKNN